MNRKRIQRLLKLWGYGLRRPRPHPKAQGRPLAVTAPNQLWQTDLSRPRLQSGPGTGLVHRLALRPRPGARGGAPPRHGTQFTSQHYREVATRLGIRLSRTRYRHPDGNAFVEGIFLSLKQDEVRPQDFVSFAEALAAVTRWILDYNTERPHQTLRYRRPAEVRQEALRSIQSAA